MHRAPVPHPPPDVGCKRACAVEKDIGPAVSKVVRQMRTAWLIVTGSRKWPTVFIMRSTSASSGAAAGQVSTALHCWVRLDSCEVVGVEQGSPREGAAVNASAPVIVVLAVAHATLAMVA